MSLPGLHLLDQARTSTPTPSNLLSPKRTTQISVPVPAGSEFRFSISPQHRITLKLIRTHDDNNNNSAIREPTPLGTNHPDSSSEDEEPPRDTAELFGAELAPGVEYSFSGARGAIVTFGGCMLSVSQSDPPPPKEDFWYTVAGEAESTADEYANVHSALEQLRDSARAALEQYSKLQSEWEERELTRMKATSAGNGATKQENDDADDDDDDEYEPEYTPSLKPATPPRIPDGGPRVLLLGPPDTGKTTLAKFLSSWAIRSNRSPCIVNLDPGEAMFALPGCVSAAVFGAGSILDVEDAAAGGWGCLPVGDEAEGIAGGYPVKEPVVCHHGAGARADLHPDVFKRATSRLADTVSQRYEQDFDVKEAGIIVDAPSSIADTPHGKGLINHVISEFSINVILALDGALYQEMMLKYPPRPHYPDQTAYADPSSIPVHVLRLSKSSGCARRSEHERSELRIRKIREYFYGKREGGAALAPRAHTLDDSAAGARLDNVFRMESATAEQGPSTSEDNPSEQRSSTPDINAILASLGKPPPVKPETSPTTTSDDLALKHTFPLPPAAAQNLLVLKHARAIDSLETIRDAAVMGYLYVEEVDGERGRVRVLCPVEGGVPRESAAVWGLWPGAVGLEGG